MAWTSNQYAYDNVYVSFGGNANSLNVGDFKFFHQAFDNGTAFVSKFNCISTLRPNGSVNPFPIFIEATEVKIQALVTTVNGSGVIVPGTGDIGLVWDYTGVGDSKIELYANDSVKLTTINTGISVTGSATVSTNFIGNANNTTEVGTYSTGAIKRIRMCQGGELHFGDTTNTAPLGITEGNWNSFGDNDFMSIFGRTQIKFYAGSTNAVLAATLQSTGLTVNTINNPNTDTDKFLVASSGLIGFRTGAEVLSDIGAGTGTMSAWSLTADSGGSATIINSATVDIAGGTNITTSRSVNTVTITNDITNNNQLTNGAGYTTNTGTVTGTGVSGRVAFWSGTSGLSSDPGFTFNNGSDALTIGGIMNWSGGNSTEANSAYDNMITGFTDSGSSTITLTLTQQDGGTLATSFSNPQGTVTEVGISHTGNAFSVGGTPINTNGTLGIDMQGTSSQYINGAGNLINLSTLAANNPTITISTGNGLTGSGSFTLNQGGATTITTSVDYGGSGLIADCPGGTGSVSENDFIMIGRDDSASGETRTYEVQEILSLGTQGTVTSVAYSHAGNAFTVGGSPITSAGTLAVTMAGNSSQYINGAGNLASYEVGVEQIQVSNPTNTAASNQPLQLSGTAAVPIVNFHRLAVQDLPNLITTETSSGVGGGVINGTWNANTQLDKTSAVDSNYQGEIVYFGSYPAGVSGAAGKIYVYTTPDGIWKPVQANAVTTTAGLLAISLGTAVSNGLLTRGTYTLSYTTVGSSEGSVLYIESASSGQVTHEPPSGSGNFVRIVGTQLDGANGQIFFHPDNTFIEL